MAEYYLAIDIGASSGRHILGHLEDGKMVLEEIYRFPNGAHKEDGVLVWEIDHLCDEVKNGIRKCAELGKIPVSLGIDTWAVDFVLLDSTGERIGQAVSYRDSRTEGMDGEVYQLIEERELYHRTGIQKQIFNTIYQLMAVKKKEGDSLEKAEKMLLIPDYLHYLLTGKAVTEYTNATTTQLVNPDTKDWDWELIEKLGYPKKIFQKITMPGTMIGNFTPEIQAEVGFDCKVVLPATHDTASAVMAVPSSLKRPLYISSGTWSLMGTELSEAECSFDSMKHNLTNEGGYDYRYRYLKNIMGMWMIQSVRKELAPDSGFDEIGKMAEQSNIPSLVDCNDQRFLAPANMSEEIQAACRETDQQEPKGIGEMAAVIYHSLALCYARTVEEIEEILGEKFEQIYIVGGGSSSELTDQLTANATGRTVFAGPTEATSIGNIAAQLLADGKLGSLMEARQCIFNSFPVLEFNPEG